MDTAGVSTKAHCSGASSSAQTAPRTSAVTGRRVTSAA